jgi:hypothetical protein
MSPLFEIIKNQVVITPFGETVEQVKKLRERFYKDKDKLYKVIEYIFKTYSKTSDFYEIPLYDRRMLTSKDIFQKPNWDKIEAMPEVKDAIDIFNEMQYTKNERLVDNVNTKIDQYLAIFQETPVTKENNKEVRELIEAAKEMLELKKKFQGLVFDEQNVKNQGGGEASLFEDNG